MPSTLRWTVIVPVKSLPAAKSRLAPMSTDAEAHGRLVEAIRADTLAAARQADGVARIVLVTDAPAPSGPPGTPDAAELHIAQRRTGLNGALRDGAEYAGDRWPGDGVVALVGDLPALRADELDAALLAAAVDGGFVADAAGTGTTLLAARPGRELTPCFGVGSAARHASLVPALDAGPGLRHDVDTAEDLTAAGRLGLGPATTAALAAAVPRTVGPTSEDTGAGRSSSVGMIGR